MDTATPGLTIFREASRQLRRDPRYALLLVTTMAIGIAAATAIFTVARGVVLRPLPYDRPDQLIALQEYQPDSHGAQTSVASANLDRFRAARSLAGVTAFSYTELVLSDGTEAERVIGAAIDGDFTSVMGVRPARGRGIESGDAGTSTARVAVLSHALWQRRYAADTTLLGQSVRIDGDPYTVVGIMPASFEFPRNPAMDRDAELWIPRQPPSPMMERRGARNLTAIARMRPGVTRAAAQAELDVIAKVAASENPRLNTGWRARGVQLREAMIGRVRPTIAALAACVAVLLVIAWANGFAATAARLTSRRPALETRVALGASRERILAVFAAEAVIAAMIATCVAVPVGTGLRALLVRLAPVAIPRQANTSVDMTAVAFALTLSLLSALVTALASAWWIRRLDVSRLVSAATRTVSGSVARSRALATFIVGQLALGTILLVATLRLSATYASLNRVDPGFEPTGVTTATIALPGMRYRDPEVRVLLTRQLVQQVQALPGVERAAVTSLLPMSGGLMSSDYRAGGAESDSTATAALRSVSPDFFQTVGIPIRLGRSIAPSDDNGAPLVAVVNEALVRRSLRGVSPLGTTIRVNAPGSDSARTFRIVGVAGDAKEKDLTSDATPIIYFSGEQASFPHTVLVIRARGAAPVSAIRATLRRLDASLALDDVSSLTSRVRATYALQIFLLAVLSIFAFSGAMLIAIGVYGSVSYAVASNLRSIGVRLALGATPARVLAGVTARVAALAVAGCAIGLGVSTVVARVAPFDPLLGARVGAPALAATAAMLLLAIGATALPAWRASATDPLLVMRDS